LLASAFQLASIPSSISAAHRALHAPLELHHYVTFIDDSTRKVWVYFLKNKSDAFSVFKRWKQGVETQTGLKIKCLKSDNGGEYEVVNSRSFFQRMRSD